MKRSIFFRLFPPPQFLQMPFVGLDISDDAIRFASFRESHGGLELARFGEIPLAKGTIEAGQINNPDVLRKTLVSLHNDHNISFARVSLPEEKAYVVHVRLPRVKRSEIRGSLELQFEEQIPIPPQEAVFDYDVIEEGPAGIDVALAALPSETALQYTDIFTDTGIVPLAFEIESQAIARAAVPHGEEETLMVVDLEGAKTGISIAANGIVRFTSTLHIGGNMLAQTVAKETNGHFDDAVATLKEKGISVHGNSPMFMALVPTLAILRDEINKHFIYWHSHEEQDGKKQPPIAKILLCGEYAVVPGIADYLASGLRVEVDRASVMKNINPMMKNIPDLSYNDSFRYVAALGLALPRLK